MQFGHLVLQLGTFVATAAAVGYGRRQDTLEASAKGPIVDLGYAKYQGGRLGTGVDEFLGVRYAKPPIGNRRFRAPEDPSSELEMQDATKVRLL